MKKIVSLILVIASLTWCFLGCNSANESKGYDKYTSLVAGIANDGHSTAVEVDFWTGVYFHKEDMADKTFVMNDISYSASYDRSINNKFNSYTTDFYNDENYIEFAVRSDTDDIVLFNVMNAEFFDTEPRLPDISNPQENAIALAKEIAGEYINIFDYTQIIEEPMVRDYEIDGVTYGITYYVIVFAKKVNGYFSSDFMSVKITSKGHFASFRMGDIGAFDDVALDFDATVLNQSITEKIESAYTEKSLVAQNFQIKDQKMALSPDGDIGVCSDVTFDVIYPSNETHSTAIRVFTTLGRKE